MISWSKGLTRGVLSLVLGAAAIAVASASCAKSSTVTGPVCQPNETSCGSTCAD